MSIIDRLADAVIAVIGGEGEGPNRLLFWTVGTPPAAFVRRDIPDQDVRSVVWALRGGARVCAYMGHANCRICGDELGSRDMEAFGMLYPEMAEHYLLRHNVWTPGCTELLRRIREAERG